VKPPWRRTGPADIDRPLGVRLMTDAAALSGIGKGVSKLQLYIMYIIGA
jgi:hypothetical protein